MTDLEIAKSTDPLLIGEIGKKIRLAAEELEPYGRFKAKIPLHLFAGKQQKGKLVLVTAISPTPAGEGKTTMTIGLTDGLNKIGKQATAVIREPSLGPVFGMKGGAAGGGHSQVIPMEDINLHFTGDFSAIEKANNLLAAMIDNNIQRKDEGLNIDPRTVLWKRVMDMNDRALRNIVTGMGGKSGGMLRETGFNITAASEVMAILCLSNDRKDLKKRLGNIYIGDTYDRKTVFARDLKAEGAMAMLLKDAINPNLVQTLEGNPAIVHGGPFANIAQGTNSIIATKAGLVLSEYVVTEAGFGADLGAEKFLDIKCRAGNLQPHAVVIVATIRALKYHGGVSLGDLEKENVDALKKGMQNLEKHMETVSHFGLPAVVAINRFAADKDAEIAALKQLCDERGVRIAESRGFAEGGKGCENIAKAVVEACEEPRNFNYLYELEDSLEDKIMKVATKAYGAKSVAYTSKARAQMKRFETLGFGNLPICIAKTQKSLSDDEKLIGRPRDFEITIREFEIATGAGFIIPIAGNMLRMPGLPEIPAAEGMDIDADGEIVGLS